MTIPPFKIEDWEAVDRIFVEGMATGAAVFSKCAPLGKSRTPHISELAGLLRKKMEQLLARRRYLK